MARADGKDRGLFKREGVWWIRYADHIGKDRREKIGASKTEARAAYQLRKDQVRRIKMGLEQPEILRARTEVTVGEAIERYRHEFERLASRSQLERFACIWAKLLGEIPLRYVQADDIEKRRSQLLAEGKKPGTVNREVSFIRRIFNLAIRDSLVDRSPVAALKPLREDNARIRFLTELEEHRLRKVMDPADFELVEVAYLTGMRREEQFRLTRKSVNLRDGWITLEKTKNGDKRRIPMRARVREILARRLGEQSTPWVFPNSAGRGAIDSANFMTRIFRPAIEAAGIEDFTWHDLRHTACSRWVMAGVPLRTVQEFAGHKSLTMTQRYSHLAPDHLQGVMEMLDQGQTPSLQLVQSGREQSS